MKRYIILLLSSLIYSTVAAQECSELLNHGIYDIRSSASELKTASSFSSWFCDQKFSSSQQADTFGASLGFPFEGIPVKLGFNSSSQSWSEWYSSFCSRVQQDQSLQSKIREHIQTINPRVLDAFNTCIQEDGLHAWLERTDDPMTFKFVTRFISPNAENPVARIYAFDTGTNVVCNDRPIIVSKPEWRTRCVRKNKHSVTIVINANWEVHGGSNLTLPAYVPPPPPPTVEKFNTLFVGLTPNCNAAIVTNHQNHLNCTNVPIGYTIKSGPAARQLLYLGVTPNVNAGVITTKSIFRGGATQEWGYTIRGEFPLQGSVPLYVVVGCGDNDGEVTTNPGHKNCSTTPIGFAYPW